MPPLFRTLLSLPLAARLLLAANVGSLLFALTMQYGFGVQPCILCLWQRVPYGVGAVAALGILLAKPYGRHSVVLLGLTAAAYLVGMGLAIFHTGVELHWWVGTSGCAVEPLHGSSPADLREALLKTVVPRCDQISWTILGFSMANLNIVLSLALAFFAGAAGVQAQADTDTNG